MITLNRFIELNEWTFITITYDHKNGNHLIVYLNKEDIYN